MLRAGYWIDAGGIIYCQKRTADNPPILHEPMPQLPALPGGQP